MRRRTLAIAAFACLMHWQSCYAQIECKDAFKLGEPIVAEAKVAEGAACDWRCQQVVTLAGGVEVIGVAEAGIVAQGSKVFCWAQPGKYRLELTVASVKDGAAVLSRHHETFTVGDVPAPVPPGPQPPGPAPVDPVGPLGQLVSAEARPLLAEFFGDLATVVRQGAFQTTSHFRNGYRKAVADAQGQGALPMGLAVVDKPVSDRITAAIGLADAPIDEAKKAALAACLDLVAADF